MSDRPDTDTAMQAAWKRYKTDEMGPYGCNPRLVFEAGWKMAHRTGTTGTDLAARLRHTMVTARAAGEDDLAALCLTAAHHIENTRTERTITTEAALSALPAGTIVTDDSDPWTTLAWRHDTTAPRELWEIDGRWYYSHTEALDELGGRARIIHQPREDNL